MIYKAEGFKNITVVVDAGHGGKTRGRGQITADTERKIAILPW